MTTTVNLKRLLDRKQWEMCSFMPFTSGTGTFVASSGLQDQYQYFLNSSTSMWVYDPFEDAWTAGPNPSLAGTFTAGTCGARHPLGPRAFPTAGTTTTITTNLTLARGLAGYTIRIIAGPNAGQEYIIKSNTVGANAVITITTTAGSAFTTASEFILVTGRMWVFNAGTMGTGSFKYYDLATNTWNNASVTGVPATWGTDGRLVATPGWVTNNYVQATATAGAASTITLASATWATNMWANYQVRIVSGTGAGQFRVIASNTSTVLTTTVAWTTTPDATSAFVVEGNDDALYLLGNASVTMYRYSISGNAWTTITPVAARTGAPLAGMSGHWVFNVSDSTWNDMSGTTNFLNGKYIYSFRGNGAVTLDRYDIAGNTWESDILYAPKNEGISSGTSYVYADDYLYINITSGGRMIKYNFAKALIEPFTQLFYGQSTNIIGDRFFDVIYTDGATKLRYLYFNTHSQNTMFRILVF